LAPNLAADLFLVQLANQGALVTRQPRAHFVRGRRAKDTPSRQTDVLASRSRLTGRFGSPFTDRQEIAAEAASCALAVSNATAARR
jgi:hypothetical protein